MILYYFIDGLGRGRDRIWAWLGNCGYDSYLRRTMLAALSGSSQLLSATYGYDNASRLASVTDGNDNSATYSYVANSPLVSQITFKQSGLTRMTTTKQWDYLNRLTQISSAPSAAYTSPLDVQLQLQPGKPAHEGHIGRRVLLDLRLRFVGA